jgi:hypothetical protein
LVCTSADYTKSPCFWRPPHVVLEGTGGGDEKTEHLGKIEGSRWPRYRFGAVPSINSLKYFSVFRMEYGRKELIKQCRLDA